MKTSILLGVPGSGKTTALISRLRKELCKGLSHTDIGFFSFTRAGTSAGGDRLRETYDAMVEAGEVESYRENDEDIKLFPFVRTYHSMAYNYGAEFPEGWRLLSWSARKTLKEEVPKTLAKYDEILKLKLKLSRRLGQHTKVIAAGKVLQEYETAIQRCEDTPSHDVLKQYREAKTALRLFDFTDLLTRFLEKGFRESVSTNKDGKLGLSVVGIDEAQDLTPIMFQIMMRWFGEDCHYIFAGDPDQCLYESLGVDPRYFTQLAADCEDVTVLNHSHRCPKSVCNVANRVLSVIPHERRVVKWMAPRESKNNAPIEPWTYTTLLESDVHIKRLNDPLFRWRSFHMEGPPGPEEFPTKFVASDIPRAYLTTTNEKAAPMIHKLLQLGIMPIVPIPNERKMGAEGYSFQWLIHPKKMSAAIEHYIKGNLVNDCPPMPKGFDGRAFMAFSDKELRGGLDEVKELWGQLERLKSFPDGRYRDAYLSALYTMDENSTLVSTIHRVKGLEFPTVILRAQWNGRDRRSILRQTGAPTDEGIRVIFTGITRARNRLYVHYPSGHKRGGNWDRTQRYMRRLINGTN